MTKEKKPKYDLDKILDEIDPEKLEEKYGEAHETARNKYKVEVAKVKDRDEFRKHARDYVRHHTAEVLKAKGVKDAPKMSDEDAEQLVKELIKSAYKEEGGFEGAYLHARKESLGEVLTSIAKALKNQEKSNAAELALTSIDPQDFDGHVEIAKQYISKYGQHLPKSLRQKTPEELAHSYAQLIQHHSKLVGSIRGTIEKYEPVKKEKKAA